MDLELCTGQGLTSSALRDLSDAEHDGVTIDPVEYALERRVFASLSVLSEKVEANCCSDSLSAWRVPYSLAGSSDAGAEADDTISVVWPYHYNYSRRDR